MIQAIFFDLDETLILDEPICEHAFKSCAARASTLMGLDLSILKDIVPEQARRLWQLLPNDVRHYTDRIGHSAFEGLWATYEASILAEANLQALIRDYRESVWLEAAKAVGVKIPVSAASELAALWAHERRSYPLYPEVMMLLDALTPKYQLGIITNGVQHLQREKIRGFGLEHQFGLIAISGELNVGKPNPGIFDWARNQLQLEPSECVMVGDNADRDVLGGLNAGWHTVWVERGFKPATHQASLEVKSMLEILPWLETLR